MFGCDDLCSRLLFVSVVVWALFAGNSVAMSARTAGNALDENGEEQNSWRPLHNRYIPRHYQPFSTGLLHPQTEVIPGVDTDEGSKRNVFRNGASVTDHHLDPVQSTHGILKHHRSSAENSQIKIPAQTFTVQGSYGSGDGKSVDSSSPSQNTGQAIWRPLSHLITCTQTQSKADGEPGRFANIQISGFFGRRPAAPTGRGSFHQEVEPGRLVSRGLPPIYRRSSEKNVTAVSSLRQPSNSLSASGKSSNVLEPNYGQRKVSETDSPVATESRTDLHSERTSPKALLQYSPHFPISSHSASSFKSSSLPTAGMRYAGVVSHSHKHTIKHAVPRTWHTLQRDWLLKSQTAGYSGPSSNNLNPFVTKHNHIIMRNVSQGVGEKPPHRKSYLFTVPKTYSVRDETARIVTADGVKTSNRLDSSPSTSSHIATPLDPKNNSSPSAFGQQQKDRAMESSSPSSETPIIRNLVFSTQLGGSTYGSKPGESSQNQTKWSTMYERAELSVSSPNNSDGRTNSPIYRYTFDKTVDDHGMKSTNVHPSGFQKYGFGQRVVITTLNPLTETERILTDYPGGHDAKGHPSAYHTMKTVTVGSNTASTSGFQSKTPVNAPAFLEFKVTPKTIPLDDVQNMSISSPRALDFGLKEVTENYTTTGSNPDERTPSSSTAGSEQIEGAKASLISATGTDKTDILFQQGTAGVKANPPQIWQRKFRIYNRRSEPHSFKSKYRLYPIVKSSIHRNSGIFRIGGKMIKTQDKRDMIGPGVKNEALPDRSLITDYGAGSNAHIPSTYNMIQSSTSTKDDEKNILGSKSVSDEWFSKGHLVSNVNKMTPGEPEQARINAMTTMRTFNVIVQRREDHEQRPDKVANTESIQSHGYNGHNYKDNNKTFAFGGIQSDQSNSATTQDKTHDGEQNVTAALPTPEGSSFDSGSAGNHKELSYSTGFTISTINHTTPSNGKPVQMAARLLKKQNVSISMVRGSRRVKGQNNIKPTNSTSSLITRNGRNAFIVRRPKTPLWFEALRHIDVLGSASFSGASTKTQRNNMTPDIESVSNTTALINQNVRNQDPDQSPGNEEHHGASSVHHEDAMIHRMEESGGSIEVDSEGEMRRKENKPAVGVEVDADSERRNQSGHQTPVNSNDATLRRGTNSFLEMEEGSFRLSDALSVMSSDASMNTVSEDVSK